jgi:hypothetical protein
MFIENLMKRIILVFVFSLVCIGINAQAVFQAGEKLSFNIGHSFVKNVAVFGVVFQTSATTVEGRAALRVQAVGKTLSGYRTFFDMNDTYETYLDGQTLRPLRFASRLQENKYRYRADYSYDWDNNVVSTRFRKLSKPDEQQRTMALQKGAGDALALCYNLRCEDIASFAVGQPRTMRLVLDDTVRVLRYKYMGRETRKIGRAGKFRTLKIVCSMASSADPDVQGELFADGSEFTLWFSDDANRIPLYIESPIKFGSIVASLTKYEGLKHPLASKVK